MHRSMATAHIPDPAMQVKLNEFIDVKKGLDRLRVGSCNACTSATQAETYSTVTEVQLRGLVLRLCPSCVKTLKFAL